MSRTTRYSTFVCTLLALVLSTGTLMASPSLDKVILDIREDFDVQHISNEDLDKLSTNERVLFDVRHIDEYRVSHIESALHLHPDTSPDEFFSQFGDQLANKTVVFYCSVGQRSSSMLSRLQDRLNKQGIRQAYNLEGGTFARHNEQRNLVSDGNLTRDIHPYNAYYGRLIDDKSGIKYK